MTTQMTQMTERYASAEALLPHRLPDLVAAAGVEPVWLGHTETFWYRNRTAAGWGYVFVDAEAGAKRPAFDHAAMAATLERLLGTPVEAHRLPLRTLELAEHNLRATVDGQLVEISLGSYEATPLGPARPEEVRSPDGRWAVGVRDHDLYLRDTATDELTRLTSDGTADHAYAGMNDALATLVQQENFGLTMPPLIVWSPDSSRFVTQRLDQREVDRMHLVRSVPPSGLRPSLLSYRYPLVGDAHVASAQLLVVEAATSRITVAACDPLAVPYISPIGTDFIWWSEDSTTIRFVWAERGERTSRVHEIDPDTGGVTVLVEERSETTIQYGPHYDDRNVRVLESGEIVLWSERSGWGHLYLHGSQGFREADDDVTTLTSGEWVVRSVVGVDEELRRVVFTAAGREGTDLYQQEICSVSLDGGEITTITADGLDHDPRPSPSGRYFVDVMSRVDVPGISVLRDMTGDVVMELERADASALYATGWTAPERVTVTSADGVTDINCAIYRPHDFDPSKSYPVLDEIYAGMHISTSPIRFPQSGGPTTAERSGAVFAALGFVVVTVDARGTALRHKAFQDHARRGGIGEFVDDHVTAIEQLARTRPWMDLDRVGIFGHSAGGYGSARALLQAPDFFRVAVSSSGDHDDRLNHSWWGERFLGPLDEFDYEAHSNASLAGNLRGRLLLAHGEMDDNAVPHGTMRLVDALIAADKDFDLLIIPNADHSLAHRQAYWIRRRWDYLVQHLMGEVPPPYRLADIPVDIDRLRRPEA